jgi:predicted pyridoxine 5'-phosphate oxidase superfamily flavin-nucleotide-binding protein
MMHLDDNVVHFFQGQGCVVVTTIDKDGFPHTACKGIIRIDKAGRIYLLDAYHGITYHNLLQNTLASITAFNEHKFIGYCLKGRAHLIHKDELDAGIAKAWEDKVTSRLTQRLLNNMHEEKGHRGHPEASLPKPQYMIVLEVSEIVDLTPAHLR